MEAVRSINLYEKNIPNIRPLQAANDRVIEFHEQ